MYPEDHKIKGMWSRYHILAIVLTTIIIWPMFFMKLGLPFFCHIIPSFTVLGLYIDIIGVIIASIEAPYFGSFADSGDVERKRTVVKEKYLKIGLTLIGIGFFFQGIAAILS